MDSPDFFLCSDTHVCNSNPDGGTYQTSWQGLGVHKLNAHVNWRILSKKIEKFRGGLQHFY